MFGFRKYGGMNHSAKNNITNSYFASAANLSISSASGQPNSKEVFYSHIDMSGNSLLHTGTIYFQDGTSLSSGLPAETKGIQTKGIKEVKGIEKEDLTEQIKELNRRVAELEQKMKLFPAIP